MFWTALLRKLAHRGLCGVKLMVSDAHEGITAIVAKVLNARSERCRVHFMRTRWRMPARAAGAWSPPSSPLRLLRPCRGRNYAIAQGRRSTPPKLTELAGFSTRPRPTYSPTRLSRGSIGPSCTRRMRWTSDFL